MRYAARTDSSQRPHRNKRVKGRPLSDREGYVLDRYLSGLSVTEIAQDMGLSVKTISTYLVRCQEKYGVYNNRELLIATAQGFGYAR